MEQDQGLTASQSQPVLASNGQCEAEPSAALNPAAEELLRTLEERMPAVLRQACDKLYEDVLYTTQEYLHQNAEYNIGARIGVADHRYREAYAALVRVADVLGSYVGSLTAPQIADQAIARAEELKCAALDQAFGVAARRAVGTELADAIRLQVGLFMADIRTLEPQKFNGWAALMDTATDRIAARATDYLLARAETPTPADGEAIGPSSNADPVSSPGTNPSPSEPQP